MKIGILCEGRYDEESLQIIVKKVILQLKPGLQNFSFVSQPAGGGIDAHIRTAAILFFSTADCDLAVFVSDTDGKKDKMSRIRALVSTHCKKVDSLASYAIGCPDPELEQWFLDEVDAVRNYFNLPNVRFPYENLKPKERFRKIIEENLTDITVSTKEVYQHVADGIDLGKLLNRNSSFKRFYNSIKKAI